MTSVHAGFQQDSKGKIKERDCRRQKNLLYFSFNPGYRLLNRKTTPSAATLGVF
jgi:hypothetical protein